ncbi:MAG: hypothetical protein U9Q15_03580 [Patescibacteria group bacterium]|nr:hypothetical protein [Patescibacteria group bacterium]
MLLILSFLSGIASGILAMIFRYYEIKNKDLYIGKQFLLQTIGSVGVIYFLYLFYHGTYINIHGYEIAWYWFFIILSSVGYYWVDIPYKLITGRDLMASTDEIEKRMK